jgi:uncharacterized protein YkwD
MRSATRPRAVRIAIVSIVTMLLLTLIPTGAMAGSGVYRDRWLMKRETNESRLSHGVRRLDLNEQMSDLARRHSLRMARKGDLFHTSDPAGYYLKGVKWRTWGENVGMTGGSVEGLQRAFMQSYYHRLNVLNGQFRRVAIGTVRRDGVLWVTVFFYG